MANKPELDLDVIAMLMQQAQAASSHRKSLTIQCQALRERIQILVNELTVIQSELKALEEHESQAMAREEMTVAAILGAMPADANKLSSK